MYWWILFPSRFVREIKGTRSRLKTIAGMVENLDIPFTIPSLSSTASLHHVIEKEWEKCQACATFTCLLIFFQTNHKCLMQLSWLAQQRLATLSWFQGMFCCEWVFVYEWSRSWSKYLESKPQNLHLTVKSTLFSHPGVSLCHLVFTYLWCNDAEVPSEPSVTQNRFLLRKYNCFLGLTAESSSCWIQGPPLT